MIYKGYHIDLTSEGITVSGVVDFNLDHIFCCGQCFRWEKEDDGSYTGVVKDSVLNVDYKDGVLILNNSSVEEFINLWFDYFDLGTDYGDIKRKLSNDPIMEKAIEFGYGIRLLKQDFYETMMSFIISSNNAIPRIKKIVNTLCKTYGKKIVYKDKEFYTFPDTKSLALPALEELAVCRAGYRCKYISQTSKMISNKCVDINYLKNATFVDARKELMNFCGIGEKVADCILLFSGIRFDVFPTDVWVKRVMEELYFKKQLSLKDITIFSQKLFGQISGYAQQYLFYYAREKRIGIKKKL